jgi:hypothetical protein
MAYKSQFELILEMSAKNTQAIDQVNARLTSMADRAGSWKQTWSQVSMGVWSTVGIVQQAVGAVQQFGRALAHIEDVVNTQRWMGQIALGAGMAHEEMMKLMRVDPSATDEQIGELAARMDEVGISARNMGEFTRFAFEKQNTSGRKFEATMAAIEKVVAGGSDNGLKKIGVFVDFAEAYQRKAESLGIPLKALTEAQQMAAREAAVLAETMKYSTPAAEGLGTAYDKVATGATNMANNVLAAISGVKGWKDSDAFIPLFQLETIQEQMQQMPALLGRNVTEAAAALEEADRLLAQVRARSERTMSAASMAETAKAAMLQREYAAIIEQASAVQDLVATKAWATLSDLSEQTANVSKITAEEWATSGDAIDKAADTMAASEASMRALMEAAILATAWLPGMQDELLSLSSALDRARLAAAAEEERLRKMGQAMQATGAQTQKWREELARLELTDPFGAQTKRLREWVAAADKASPALRQMAADLRGLLPDAAKEYDIARRLTGDPREIEKTAAALRWVATHTERFQKAMQTGDRRNARQAFDNLATATEALQYRLDAVGGSTQQVNTLNHALVEGLKAARQSMLDMSATSESVFAGMADDIALAYARTAPVLAAWWKKVAAPPPKQERSAGGASARTIEEFDATLAAIEEAVALEQDTMVKAVLQYEKAVYEASKAFADKRIREADRDHRIRMAQIEMERAITEQGESDKQAAIQRTQEIEQAAHQAKLAILQEESEAAQRRAEEEQKITEARMADIRAGVDTFANAASNMQRYGGDFGGQVSASMGHAKTATAAFTDAWAKGGVEGKKAAASGIAASGSLAASVIKNKRTAAAVEGLFELAAGWQSFGAGDYIGAGAHWLSSGLYFALAGKGGGSKGSAAVGGSQGSAGAAKSTMRSESSGAVVNQTIVLKGLVAGEARQLGAEVVKLANMAVGRSQLDARLIGSMQGV